MGILHARNFVTEDDAIGGSKITKSLRFNDTDTYLSKSYGSPDSGTTFTFSAWIKRSEVGNWDPIFGSMNGSNAFDIFGIDNSDRLIWRIRNSSSSDLTRIESTNRLRDTSAWYHVLLERNSTLSTAGDRAKLYINGVRVTEFDQNNTDEEDQTYSGTFLTNLQVGRTNINSSSNYYLHGYLAEVYYLDGIAYDPTYFGFTDGQTGIWRPKKYEGAFGTNGVYLPLREGSVFKEYVVPTASFSDDANTIFLLNNNESNGSTTFTDTEGNTVSAVGDVQHSTAQAKFGSSSIIFDGSGDNLSVGGNGTFLSDLTTSSNRTYEGWIWFDSYVYTYLYSASSNQQYLGVAINAAATGSYIVFNGNSPSPYTAAQGDIPGGAWPLNQWVHVFVQRNADGSMLVGFDGKILYEGPELANNTTSGTVGPMKIGSQHYYSGTNRYFHDGYMDELRMSDTPRYTSSAVNSIGRDLSGNNNFFIPSGFASDDLVLDSPTNNFCTLNPLTVNMGASSNGTVSNGNLEWLGTQNNDNIAATIAVKSGKWYYEMTVGQNADKLVAGWTTVQETTNYTESALIYYNSAGIRDSNKTVVWDSTVTSSLTFATNDVIGFALNLDDYFLYVYENGSLVSTITLPTDKGDTWIPCCGDSSSTDASATFNFGQQSFTYTPPTGYKSLNSTNLIPNVPSVQKPQKHFETLLWTGTGSSHRISGLSFTPDFVWLKKRSGTGSNNLFDTIRGATKRIQSDTTSAESTVADGMTSFNVDGFTLGSNTAYNGSGGGSYVAWCWKAGGAAVSNTDGTVTSSVSANPAAGFSIVSYVVPSGSGYSVGHGLGAVPKLILAKNRDTSSNWDVYSAFIPNTKRLKLNSTAAEETQPAWNNQTATSTVFYSLGGGSWHGVGGNMINYVFCDVPGYSKFGKFTGNGSNDGPFIHLNFRPAFVIIKRTDSTSSWQIWDNKRDIDNVTTHRLRADLLNAEDTGSVDIDFLSNGFKLRNTGINQSGGTYIYIAFAEQPGFTPLDTFPNAR